MPVWSTGRRGESSERVRTPHAPLFGTYGALTLANTCRESCASDFDGGGSSSGRARDCEFRGCGFEARSSPWRILRSVAQFGQRTCLGRKGPQVRILPLRLSLANAGRNYMHVANAGKALHAEAIWRSSNQDSDFGRKASCFSDFVAGLFVRGCAGNGRRARLRSARAKVRGGSNPSSRIGKFGSRS